MVSFIALGHVVNFFVFFLGLFVHKMESASYCTSVVLLILSSSLFSILTFFISFVLDRIRSTLHPSVCILFYSTKFILSQCMLLYEDLLGIWSPPHPCHFVDDVIHYVCLLEDGEDYPSRSLHSCCPVPFKVLNSQYYVSAVLILGCVMKEIPRDCRP
jgi:hypothetical protein